MRPPNSLLFLLAITLVGCDAPPATIGSSGNDPAEMVGRFAYYPPAGEMPAVLLDTVTGCVEVFGKSTNVENPQDVDWWRSSADVSIGDYTEIDGEWVEIDGTKPPSRCNYTENDQ